MSAPVRLADRRANPIPPTRDPLADVVHALQAMVRDAIEQGVARVLAVQEQTPDTRVPAAAYTIKQTAQALNCGERNVRNLIRDGELLVIPVGRDRRVLVDSLRTYLTRAAKRECPQ